MDPTPPESSSPVASPVSEVAVVSVADTPVRDDRLVPVAEADHLEQDQTIRGQNYACVSFVSPKDAIASKDAYLSRRFLGDVSKDVTATLDTIVELLGVSNPGVVDTVRLLKERHAYLWDEGAVQTEYRLFCSQKASELDDGFRKEHGNFKTSVQGIKIRGVYDTLDEAKNRAKAISRFDSKFDVFVCEVGCWCPWSPNADDLQNVEYAETQLNTLMKKYNEGQDARDIVYDARKTEKIGAIDEDREIWIERIKAEVIARNKERAENAPIPEAPVDSVDSEVPVASEKPVDTEEPVTVAED
jgi:hypothetical protein